MKQVFLYKGRGKNKKKTDVFALVDDDHFDLINQFKWGYMKLYHCESNILYANRYEVTNGKTNAILMHRVILGLSDRKQKCDHIDGNTLNNQKSNLRIATHAENMSNRIKKANCASKYLGVVFINKSKKWQARMRHYKVIYRSHPFPAEEDAARAYNEMAVKHKGEFARLNIITR